MCPCPINQGNSYKEFDGYGSKMKKENVKSEIISYIMCPCPINR